MERTGPLRHIRVLDLTHARAGPSAVRLLADWGADVIKIEQPPDRTKQGRGVTGARRGPDEQNLHRNKRGLTLNLKHADGLEIFMSLVETADVIVENFRSEVKHRLGVDYEAVKAVNSAVIYASISGFGQDGPYGTRAGVDQIVQGMSGLMSVTGEPGQGPMRVGIAISDTSAGMFLGQGILLALLHRERTGEGQWVHTSLLESMMCKLDFQGARYTMSGDVPAQAGNHHPTQVAMGTFNSRDGLVNVAAPSQRMWQKFCDALEADELLERAEYRSGRDRAKHKEALKADINTVTENYTTDELVERLNEVGVPCGPINDIGQGFEDEQVQYLKMAKPAPHPDLGDLKLIRSPINLSGFPQADRFDRAAPDAGADNADLLHELGIDGARQGELRENGTI